MSWIPETNLGYGYIIDDDDIADLDEDIYDELCESNYFYPIDPMRDKGLYFFGLILGTLEPGEIAVVPIKNGFPPIELKNMVQEYKRFFPEKTATAVRHYVMNRYV